MKLPFRIPVFICGPKWYRWKDSCFKKVGQKQKYIAISYDLRSPKWIYLRKIKCIFGFYDKEEKIQLELVICEINNKNSITEDPGKKLNILVTMLPYRWCTCFIKNPTSGMISKLRFWLYDEQSEKGYENFTVIKCNIKSIEWLYLAAKGHRKLFLI